MYNKEGHRVCVNRYRLRCVTLGYSLYKPNSNCTKMLYWQPKMLLRVGHQLQKCIRKANQLLNRQTGVVYRLGMYYVDAKTAPICAPGVYLATQYDLGKQYIGLHKMLAATNWLQDVER